MRVFSTHPRSALGLPLLLLLLLGRPADAEDEPVRALGGWAPAQELLELARALGAADAPARSAAVDRLGTLTPAERVRVLRAGLRLEDGPAARACAARLHWTQVDDAESARIVQLGLLDALEPGSAFDFDEVRSLLGSTELGPLLERLGRAPPVAAVDDILGSVHRQVRPEHLPALAELSLNADAPTAGAALDVLRIAVGFTDQHREDVARALIALGPWPATTGPSRAAGEPRLRAIALAPKQGGWPALLVASVESLWLEEERSPDWRWEIDRWALRWMRAERAAAEDVPLLARLARLGTSEGESGLLRATADALGDLADDASRLLLEEIARGQGPSQPAGLAAIAALGRRGGREWRQQLLELAGTEPPGLALALAADMDSAVGGALLRQQLLAADPEVSGGALELVDDSLSSRWPLHDGPPIPERAFDGLADAALASELDGLALARLGAVIPACRTRRVAAAAVELLRESPSAEVLEASGGRERLFARELAFLEVADLARLTQMLRSWAARDDAPAHAARDLALLALLHLGDPESGAALASWVGGGAADKALGRDRALLLLARSAGPAVREALDALLASAPTPGALAAWAVLSGLPEPVAEELVAWGAFLPADGGKGIHPDRARLVREGRIVEFVLEVCFGDDWWGLGTVGLLRDERILEALRRVQREREQGAYLWATTQLMLAGDPQATQELDRAFRTGRYRWIDTTPPLVLTLGGRLDRLEAWFDDLEANCCRYNPIAEAFAHPDGDLVQLPDGRVASTRWTPAAIVRRAWQAAGGVAQPFSRLAGLHVPVVR